MNWKASEQPEIQAGSITLEDPKGRSAPSPADPAGDWLCAFCFSRVTNERARFQYDGRDEFVFSNPGGFQFEIITFSETYCCRQSGTPSLDHTWFPGHAWSFCQCAECGQHLGWFYNGQYAFAGLIKEKIVRVLGMRN